MMCRWHQDGAIRVFGMTDGLKTEVVGWWGERGGFRGRWDFRWRTLASGGGVGVSIWVLLGGGWAQ